MDPVHLISYLSSLSNGSPHRTHCRAARVCGSAGRRCLAGWPRGASRLPLAASPHLTGWLLASLLPSRPSLRPCCAAACSACLPACRCGAADCRRPRAPAARPVPGRSPAWSRLARARCAAAGCRAPDARYGWMDSGSLDWDRVETLSCLFVQLGLAALGFRV